MTRFLGPQCIVYKYIWLFRFLHLSTYYSLIYISLYLQAQGCSAWQPLRHNFEKQITCIDIGHISFIRVWTWKHKRTKWTKCSCKTIKYTFKYNLKKKKFRKTPASKRRAGSPRFQYTELKCLLTTNWGVRVRYTRKFFSAYFYHGFATLWQYPENKITIHDTSLQ